MMISDIQNKRNEIRNNILKSFGSTEDILDFEKAHKDGDLHPNGKWVWVSSAAGGKGDWRTLNGRTHKKHQAGNGGGGKSSVTQPSTAGAAKTSDGGKNKTSSTKTDEKEKSAQKSQTAATKRIMHYLKDKDVFDEDKMDNHWKDWYESTRKMEQQVARIIGKQLGVKPNYNDFHGRTVLRLGDFRPKDGGTRVNVYVGFDSKLRLRAGAKRVSRGGCYIKVEYPGYGGDGDIFSLHGMSEKDINNLISNLKKINDYKLEDVWASKQVDPVQAAYKNIKSILK